MEKTSLTQLCCSTCMNYLSVPPISIDRNGNSICGRCKIDIDISLFIHNIHYEHLVRNYLFPCRFESEGCFIKQPLSKMKVHEESCIYQKMYCKECIWSGILTELIIHYSTNHQKLIITNDCLKQLFEGDGCFLLDICKFYFLIEWNYHNYKLKITMKSLNSIDLNGDICITYKISSIKSDNFFEISNSLKLCDNAVIDLQNNYKDKSMFSLLFSISVFLSPNIIKKREDNLNKIVCPNCLRQMVPPILRCRLGDVTCVDCTGSNYNECNGCGEYEMQFTRDPELEHIAIGSQYTCKWDGCGANFSVREIQAHEQVCIKRSYSCHHCHDSFGSLNEIVTHDPQCREKTQVCPIFEDTKLIVSVTSEELWYTLIAYNEIFWIRFQLNDDYIRISICNYAPASLWSWYRYEADLEHTTDVNCPFNRTYNIQSHINEFFNLYLPVDCVYKFGGFEFCKFTVRVIMLDNNQTRSVTTYFPWR